MKLIILAVAILSSNLEQEFRNGCIGGDKSDYVCAEKAREVGEFTDACIGGNKTMDDCINEALRRTK